jgi:hypothetical protein
LGKVTRRLWEFSEQVQIENINRQNLGHQNFDQRGQS